MNSSLPNNSKPKSKNSRAEISEMLTSELTPRLRDTYAKFATSDQSTINQDIRTLETFISDNRKVLNDEGVWLFLATLGCWSVGQSVFQIFAFLITAYLFAVRVDKRQSERKFLPVTQSLIEIERRIKELPDNDTRKARLYELDQLQKHETAIIPATKKTLAFIFTWVFFGASFIFACAKTSLDLNFLKHIS
jgi:hypothetical protein